MAMPSRPPAGAARLARVVVRVVFLAGGMGAARLAAPPRGRNAARRCRNGSLIPHPPAARTLVFPRPKPIVDYKETVNLPKTGFPMKANLPQREPEILR